VYNGANIYNNFMRDPPDRRRPTDLNERVTGSARWLFGTYATRFTRSHCPPVRSFIYRFARSARAPKLRRVVGYTLRVSPERKYYAIPWSTRPADAGLGGVSCFRETCLRARSAIWRITVIAVSVVRVYYYHRRYYYYTHVII
jgi:hypothetical protein